MDMPVNTRTQNKEKSVATGVDKKASAKFTKDSQGKMDKFVQSKEREISSTEVGEKESQETPKTRGAEASNIDSVLAEILAKVKPIEDISKKLENFTAQMSEMNSSIREHDNQLKALTETTGQHTEDLKQMRDRLSAQEKVIHNQAKASDIEAALKAENYHLKQRLLKLEEYSRRKNLVFTGLEEKQSENCVQLIQHYLVTQLKLQGDMFKIENAHRKGPRVLQKARPVIVQFASNTQAQEVYKHRFNERRDSNVQQTKSKVFITRDWPDEILKSQVQLRKLLKPAKRIDQDAHIVRDKLIFKTKAYDLERCYSLKELEIEKIGTVQRTNYVLFFGRFSPFSNFYPSGFVLDGKHYNCVEQYFQAEKSRFLGKASVTCQILNATDPVTMKSLGNQLEGDLWPEVLQESTMRKGLLAKFGQNKQLCAFLKESKGKALIECNKHDHYWGNGRSIYDSKAAEGTGRNRLGNLLVEVRDLIEQ